MKIKSVEAIEILDSRGNPTVEVNVTLEDGTNLKVQANRFRAMT